MELSYKPETQGPAVQDSAGLKRIWEVRIQAADVALIHARDPGSCSTRQCRVKKDMGSEHSGRGWRSHTNQIRQCRVKKDTGYTEAASPWTKKSRQKC
jgi:hypothetical protein